jgi:catechol 2,3-dioxygenase-like lactoylglutathione lyase family enzyme
MILGIDHVVILVNDLTQAIDDYTALGFTVTPGGEHADGSTHNALIVFADGSYLELLAFQRPTPEHHWWRHVEIGEGLIDWALLPDAISEDIEAARDAGVPFTGPIPGGRLRPDGQQIAWEMGFPQMQGLPFLCGDITPRALRVPDGAARKHANGAVGIATITIAVNDIHASLPACPAQCQNARRERRNPRGTTARVYCARGRSADCTASNRYRYDYVSRAASPGATCRASFAPW